MQKPSAETVRHFLVAREQADFTYPAVGATAGQIPAGFVVDRTRRKLGEGERVFLAAKAALGRWAQLDLGWMQAWQPETSVHAGAGVAIAARAMGLWWPNACRIVYVVDEPGPISRFGVAYGTLPDHAARGEERFLVEWDQNDGGVWYDILAFSRPSGVLARLGYPMLRRTQKRFGPASAAAMVAAVRG